MVRLQDQIDVAAELISKSKHLIALTGSGISAESGIPTFRGKDGLWNKYRPEELATFDAFIRNPRIVWEWYSWRINLILNAKPNPAHITLVELEHMGILKRLITQNVDDLHERAGSKKIIKLHGDILVTRCISCDYKSRLKAPPNEIPPKCPKCGNLLRPGVVWFGESLPSHAISEALKESKNADVMLVIGTSGVVYPAGYLPIAVKENKGSIIEVNTEETMITRYVDVFLQGKAGEILPQILKTLQNL